MNETPKVFCTWNDGPVAEVWTVTFKGGTKVAVYCRRPASESEVMSHVSQLYGSAYGQPTAATRLDHVPDYCPAEPSPTGPPDRQSLTTTAWEFVTREWLGTPDGSAPEGSSVWPYFDRAWQSTGHTGDCPETFPDETTARQVAGAIREDKHGVMPRVTVRPVTG